MSKRERLLGKIAALEDKLDTYPRDELEELENELYELQDQLEELNDE